MSIRDSTRPGHRVAVLGRRASETSPTETRTSMSYALTTTIHRPFGDTLAATRASLVDQGFGILTEIDIQATLKAKLDVDIPPQVILGACRPPLAHAAPVSYTH